MAELGTLVGPSGCDKTTLLSVIAGLLDSNGGDLEVLGEKPARMTKQDRIQFRRRNLGVVFQRFNLLPGLTADRKRCRAPCWLLASIGLLR